MSYVLHITVLRKPVDIINWLCIPTEYLLRFAHLLNRNVGASCFASLSTVARLKGGDPLLLLERLNQGRKKLRVGKQKSQGIHILIAFGTAATTESRPWPYVSHGKRSIGNQKAKTLNFRNHIAVEVGNKTYTGLSSFQPYSIVDCSSWVSILHIADKHYMFCCQKSVRRQIHSSVKQQTFCWCWAIIKYLVF